MNATREPIYNRSFADSADKRTVVTEVPNASFVPDRDESYPSYPSHGLQQLRAVTHKGGVQDHGYAGTATDCTEDKGYRAGIVVMYGLFSVVYSISSVCVLSPRLLMLLQV